MLNTGMLIAIDVTILYLIMGPLVLYALYVVFDSLGQGKAEDMTGMKILKKRAPALWSDEDISL
ncbi:MAG: hypothetical protein QM498_13180 [Desulfobacterium sp.]